MQVKKVCVGLSMMLFDKPEADFSWKRSLI